MRHATDADLDRIDDLLDDLRSVEQLRERKRGNFQLGSRAFLHFHAHGEDLIADVRLDGVTFDRRVVTTREAQRALVSEIASTLTKSTG